MTSNNELQEFLDSSIKKTSNFTRVLGIIITCSLVIGIYSLLSNQSLLQKENQQLIVKADSLEKTPIRGFEQDSLIKIVRAIINTQKTEETLHRYFAPVLQRYYLKSKVPLQECINLWKEKTNEQDPKRQKVIFADSDISISFTKPESTALILIKTMYTPDTATTPLREIIYELKVDSLYKVYSVRNLLPASP
jgi:hypothetical protein